MNRVAASGRMGLSATRRTSAALPSQPRSSPKPGRAKAGAESPRYLGKVRRAQPRSHDRVVALCTRRSPRVLRAEALVRARKNQSRSVVACGALRLRLHTDTRGTGRSPTGDVLRRGYRAYVSEWAPVVAALGTGVIGFGGLWWQQRHRDDAAAEAKRTDAYHQMIAESLSFSIRAHSLRTTMRARSGLGDRLDFDLRLRPRDLPEMTLRSRAPADPLQLHDWLAQGFQPVNQAWSWIEIIGSAQAVDAATETS